MATDWTSLLSTIIPSAVGGISAITGANATKSAANTQSASAQQALSLLQQIYQSSQGNLAPWQTGGQAALGQLLKGLGMYSPAMTTGGANPTSVSSPIASLAAPGASPLSNIQALSLKPPSQLQSMLKGITTGAGLGAAGGAAIGSIGGPIGTAIGAGVGTLSTLFGRGRKQADTLTPTQNAVGNYVDQITKAVDAAKANGTLNATDLQAAINAVKSVQTQFGQVASQFDKAGPGGVATLAKYFDPMTADWTNQLAGLQQTGGSPAPGGSTTSTTTANGMPDGSGVDFNYFNTTPDANALLSQDPGYQARLDQGNKELNASLAARGLVNSGGALKSAAKYGQTYASNEYQNAYNRYQQQKSDTFNRLATVAGYGQNANGQSITLGDSFGNNASGLITGAGNAQAAGTVGAANAINNGVSQAGSAVSQSLTLSQLLKSMQGNQAGGGGGNSYSTPTVTYNDPNQDQGDGF